MISTPFESSRRDLLIELRPEAGIYDKKTKNREVLDKNSKKREKSVEKTKKSASVKTYNHWCDSESARRADDDGELRFT